MQVSLSIVGFAVHVPNLKVFDNPEGTTVKTVLDSFMALSQFPFSYDVVPSPFRKGTNLLFSFTYKGIRLKPILTTQVGMEERVWQFYVSDKNGISIPNDSGQGRKAFDQFEVKDGYIIKWRLITVIKQPAALTKRVRNNTTPEQAHFNTETHRF